MRIMPNMGWFLIAAVLPLASDVSAQVDTAWVRQFGVSAGSDDEPFAMTQSPSGDFFVAGITSAAARSPQSDMLILKYWPTGKLAWFRTVDGGSRYNDRAYAVASGSDGAVAITGISDKSASYADILTVKFDSVGNQIWSRRYNGPGWYSGDRGSCCTIDLSGSVYVAGTKSENELFLIKYGAAGDSLWAWSLPDTSEVGFATAYGLALDSTGSVNLVGKVGNTFSAARLDTSGQLLWSRAYASDIARLDWMSPPAISATGEITMIGRGKDLSSPEVTYFATVSYDPLGNLRWESLLVDPEEAQGLALAAEYGEDESVYVTGISGPLEPGQPGDHDLVTLRYDSNGGLMWMTRYEPAPWPSKITLDPGGDILITAYGVLLRYSPEGELIAVLGEGLAYGPLSAGSLESGMATCGTIRGDPPPYPRPPADILISVLAETKFLSIDALPGSCPNIINTGGIDLDYHGVRPGAAAAKQPTVPVAMLGTKSFDASRVDPKSIRIAGLAPLSSRLMDVSRPSATHESPCECTTLGSDGYEDLVLYFDQSQLVAALGPITDGEVRTVALTGKTKTGVPLSGIDCLTITSQPIHIGFLAGADHEAPSGLVECRPNPFNASTVIVFALGSDQHVQLAVFNVLGQLVATLVDADLPAGSHEATWNANGTASGVYFARLTTPSGVQTKQMALVK